MFSMSTIVVGWKATRVDSRWATVVDLQPMSTEPLTKQSALDLYDGNQAALGRALGISRQAINKLPDGPLPEWMDLKIRFVLKPGSLGQEAA